MTDPFPYATTDIVIVQHRWWDANTRRGVQADITWQPITNSGDALTPNLVDVDARGWVKTRTWRSRPHPYSGYLAVPLVATNDPDLSSLAGFAGYRVQAAGEAAFTITVDHDVDETPATVEMSQALAQLDPPVSVAPGDMVRAVWLTDLAVLEPPPPPPSAYFTAAQTTHLVLDTVAAHDDDTAAHPDLRGSRVTKVVIAASGAPAGSADYVCTGTEDQATINTALNAAAATGGTVLLRAGEYRIDAPIFVPDHTSLIGESKPGWKAYVGSYPTHNQEADVGTKIKVVAAGVDYAITWAATNPDTPGDPRVRALRISYLYVYGYQGTGVGIGCPMNAWPADSCEFSDNYVHNVAVGIAGNLDAPIIRGNNVQDVSSHGISVAAMYGSIEQNICFDLGGAGIRVVGGAKSMVVGNACGDTGAEGIVVSAPGVTVTGNSVAAPTNHAILAQGVGTAVVANTVAMENPAGGHDLNSDASNAVHVTADCCSVTGNTLRRDTPTATGDAVYLADPTARCSVVGNTIRGPGFASNGPTTVRWRGGAGHQVGLNAGDNATALPALPSATRVYSYAASDLAPVADGATVTTWPDNIGGSKPLALTNVTYKASGIGGQPAVRFNGSSSYGICTTGATTQPVTIFIVASKTSAVNSVTVLMNSYSGDEIALFLDSGPYFSAYAGGFLGGPSGFDPTAGHIYEAVINGSASHLALDGANDTSGDAGTQGLGAGLTVGAARNGSGQFFDGDIYEVVVYNGALSSGDRQTIRAALGAKYGISTA